MSEDIYEYIAKAMNQRAIDDGWDGPPWEELPEEAQQQAIRLAKAAVEAAREFVVKENSNDPRPMEEDDPGRIQGHDTGTT